LKRNAKASQAIQELPQVVGSGCWGFVLEQQISQRRTRYSSRRLCAKMEQNRKEMRSAWKQGLPADLDDSLAQYA